MSVLTSFAILNSLNMDYYYHHKRLRSSETLRISDCFRGDRNFWLYHNDKNI